MKLNVRRICEQRGFSAPAPLLLCLAALVLLVGLAPVAFAAGPMGKHPGSVAREAGRIAARYLQSSECTVTTTRTTDARGVTREEKEYLGEGPLGDLLCAVAESAETGEPIGDQGFTFTVAEEDWEAGGLKPSCLLRCSMEPADGEQTEAMRFRCTLTVEGQRHKREVFLVAWIPQNSVAPQSSTQIVDGKTVTTIQQSLRWTAIELTPFGGSAD